MARNQITPAALDTNVLLRFLVGDNKTQQQRARDWFTQAEQGKRKIIILPLVVAETCFVLESFYKKNRDEIASTMEVFLSQRWLVVNERRSLLNLWRYYRQGLHFVDSFLLSWTDFNPGQILTFDNKLARMGKRKRK